MKHLWKRYCLSDPCIKGFWLLAAILLLAALLAYQLDPTFYR